MIDKRSTCQGCPDRVVGCHSACAGYQARVEVNRARNAQRRMYAQALTSEAENAKRIRNARARAIARKARRLDDDKI